MSSDRPRVVVVGAGVFGAATADALATRGWHVTLIERFEPGHPRASSGGHSRLLRSAHGAQPWYTAMAWAARTGWRTLEADTSRSLLLETGLVWFARDDTGWEADSFDTCADAGVPVERLTPDEVAALYPSVRTDDLAFGLWEPHGGVLRATDAVRALVVRAQAAGARLRTGTAAVAERRDAVRVDNDVLRADRIVWACGPWTVTLWAHRVSLAVTQQDVCFFAVPDGWRADQVPAWVDFRGGAYGLGDLDGHGVKCSSDRQGPPANPDGDRVPHPDNLRRADEILAHRFPALTDAPRASVRVCQYTTTADTEFVIAPLDDDRCQWIVGGGSGHGFKHGPALGTYVADVVDGTLPPDTRFGLQARRTQGSLRTAGHLGST